MLPSNKNTQCVTIVISDLQAALVDYIHVTTYIIFTTDIVTGRTQVRLKLENKLAQESWITFLEHFYLHEIDIQLMIMKLQGNATKDPTYWNAIQYDTTQYSRVRHKPIQYSTTQHNIVEYDTSQYNTVRHNTIY